MNAKHALPGTVTGLKTQKTATGSITLEWNKKSPRRRLCGVPIYCRQEADKALGHHHRPQLCVQGQRRQAGHQILFYVAPYTVDSKTKEGAKGTRLATHPRPTATQMHRRQIRQKAADYRALE